MNNSAILLISCKDALGITAAVTNFIFQNKGNILHADQHIDDQTNTFFMRVEWSLEHFELLKREAFTEEFEKISQTFQMNWELSYSNEKQKCAIFVSKKTHCLIDILNRHKENQLNCHIDLILSNHTNAKEIAQMHNIDFQHFPITKENKTDQETVQFKLLSQKNINFLILAQYHQILTPYLINEFPNKIINIHHSFLP
ncbi:Formyltetrahydrofolate deformylase, partial [hydrothermal vent metagenome]